MTNANKLTELEKDVIINGLGNTDFIDIDGCPDVWGECIVDTCKITTKDQISGVVSSLVKKNLVKVMNAKTKASTVQFTPEGLKVLEQLITEQSKQKPLAPFRASLNIEQCMSMLHDVRYRYDLTDDDRADILKDVYNILGDTYDLLRW